MAYAVVSPHHGLRWPKKDNKELLESYSPIALVSAFSKIVEKYINEKIYKYLENKNILSESQKGFRKNMTINMAIYDFLNRVISSVDKKRAVCSIYCDMTQAF